jgi:hypothetical protein
MRCCALVVAEAQANDMAEVSRCLPSQELCKNESLVVPTSLAAVAALTAKDLLWLQHYHVEAKNGSAQLTRHRRWEGLANSKWLGSGQIWVLQ